jgi:hypothetical protein
LHSRRIEITDLPVDLAEVADFGHALDLEQPLATVSSTNEAQLFERHVVGFNRYRKPIGRLPRQTQPTWGFENAVGQAAAHAVNRGLRPVHRPR